MNYLESGFDPKESKVSELRRILAENNVGYPSKAKKSVLIKLFDTSVKPKIGDLRKRQSVGPSSEGIEKVKSPKKKKRSRDARLKEEKGEEEEETFGKGKKEQISIDIVDVDGDIKMELSPRKSSKKSKKSTDPNDESSKKKKRRKNQKKTHDENRSRTDITSSPEKSLVIEKFESNSFSSDSLNTTFTQFSETEKKNAFITDTDLKPVQPTRRTQAPDITKLIVSEEFKSKLNDAMADQESESISVEVKSEEEQPSVETTSEVEQVPIDVKSEEEIIPVDNKVEKPSNNEVVPETTEPVEKATQDITATGNKIESKKNKNPKGKKCLKGALKLLSKSLYFSTIASAVLLSVWGREQQIRVGFCGNELPLKSITGRFPENHTLQLIDQYLEKTIKPECLPCPKNAICSSELQMECEEGFNYVQSPLSLDGLIPIPGNCVPDDSEERAFTKVVDHTMKYLRSKNNAIDCGKGENDLISGISEEELYEYILEDISEEFRLSKEKISQLWSSALKKIEGFPEIEHFQVKEDSEGREEQDGSSKKVGYLRSTSRKGLSLTCLYDNEIKNFCSENLLSIWGVVGTLFSSFLLKRSWEKNSQKKAKVDTYVKRATDILKKTANSDEGVPFLHTLQLKEEILSDITDLNEKNQIWDQLIEKLEEDNTNISSSQAEIQGEIIKCWKWIGDIDQK